jgi:hypothetical protein
MPYAIQESRIFPKGYGIASVVSTNSVARLEVRPGTTVRGFDPTLGGGKFIYLPTIASVTVGSLVRYIQSASGVYTTSMVPNTAGLSQPVAVAMVAGAANNYAWFQIEGTAPVKKAAVKINSNVALFISATTGRVTGVVASGKSVVGMRSSNSASVLSATSVVYCTFIEPHMQGAVI